MMSKLTAIKSKRRPLLQCAAGAAATGILPMSTRLAVSAVVEDSPVVETRSGKVRGSRGDGVFNFKGIPYGQSTAGANRFMPPIAATPWTGVRDALDYGPRAPQNERPSALPHVAWIRDT